MFLLVNDLADVLAQYGADLREGAVEAAGQRSHSCRSSEGNQSQNQEILHQTLARLIFVKAIQGIQNQSFHNCHLLVIFHSVDSQRSRGAPWVTSVQLLL